ncbi:hypothetical protein MKZ38_005578 [Zalerion maritima]|uniref:Zn(2)-C6 fungal-type domain-containing protein n=1 Tax=Zalerion maritima TaxID=339359 RepID=A0AAD5RJX1_9PEZI|nr:hypothetical protein MKZ38_005578 [Zalerion maritima]
MSTAVKRACDACHRRKVKCDGVNPCRNCSSAQLSCTYNAIPQKKGPKGSRAKVISELRETQRQTSLSAKIHHSLMNPGQEGALSQTMSLKGTPGLLAMDTIKAAIDFYFDYLYPIAPILHRQRVLNQATYMEQNQSMDTYCLLSSLTAYTMIQPGAPLPGADNGFNLASIPGAHVAASQILIEETVRVRKGLDYMMNPTFNSLCTSYFLFAANFTLDYMDQAWFYLREATSIMLMHNMHLEETYRKFDNVEASRRRRLFWLFFTAERWFALKRGESRPLSLQPSVNLPTLGDDPTDPFVHQIGGFLSLTNLFRTFDQAFTGQWNKIRNDFDKATIDSLGGQFSKVSPTLANFSTPMEDLPANQNWLKNIDWRMRYQNGTLSPDEQEANMAIQFGHDYSPDIMSMQSQFSAPSMGMVDSAMLNKMFNISYSLIEHLKTKPSSRNPLVRSPRDHLNEVLNILSVLRNRDHRFLPYLMAKLHDTLLTLPAPMLSEVPEQLTQSLANIDIFDGFGSLGMAPMDYEEKKYMPASADMNGSTTTGTMSMGAAPTTVSMADMTSPFSPAIMSPGGMEFPQTLQDFNSPLDMAMSPVARGPQQNMQGMTSSPPGMNMNPPPSQTQQQGPSMQQQPMTPHQRMNPQQMQGMNPQMSMGGMMPNGLMGRPGHQHHQPQRANSFAMGGPRTVADFQALTRVKTEPQVSQLSQAPQPGGIPGQQPNMNPHNLGMNMSEIDFSNLR